MNLDDIVDDTDDEIGTTFLFIYTPKVTITLQQRIRRRIQTVGESQAAGRGRASKDHAKS